MTLIVHDKTVQLEALLKERILVLDGAMGTMIQVHRLDEAGYRGERFKDWPRDLKGNNDLLILSQPEIIRSIHAAYFEAGADIVETNTFNSTVISQADYGMEALVHELNVEGARLALPPPTRRRPGLRTSRALWQASWDRPIGRPRSRQTSTIRDSVTSPTTAWWWPTTKRRAA